MPLHDHVGGPKRRKVTRTTINDRGEEVTEEVREDIHEVPADEANAAQPQGCPAKSFPANSPAAKDPAGSSEDVALKEQPGQQRHWTMYACRTVLMLTCDFVLEAIKVASAAVSLRMLLHDSWRVSAVASLVTCKASFT